MLKQLRKKCDKYKLQLTHTDTYLKYNINSTSLYILTHVAGRSKSNKGINTISWSFIIVVKSCCYCC